MTMGERGWRGRQARYSAQLHKCGGLSDSRTDWGRLKGRQWPGWWRVLRAGLRQDWLTTSKLNLHLSPQDLGRELLNRWLVEVTHSASGNACFSKRAGEHGLMKQLYQLLAAETQAWREDGYPCDAYPVIGEILDWQTDPETGGLRYLRKPQLRAL